MHEKTTKISAWDVYAKADCACAAVAWIRMMMFVLPEVYSNPHNWLITCILGVKQQAALLTLVECINYH